MSEVKWIRLTLSMFDDEKIKIIESMPEKDTVLIIWIKLLVLAGKTNDAGYIYLSEHVPYSDEMLSTLFNRPLSSVRLALRTLQQFQMIDFQEDFLFIRNWDRHQNVQGLDKIREQTRERVQKYRERKKMIEQPAIEEMVVSEKDCNATVTLRNATEEERELEEDIDKEEDIEEKKEPPVPYKEIQDLFNNICKSLSNVRSITKNRQPHVKARWKQFDYDINIFEEAFKKLEESNFCKGNNDKGWKANFDWIIGNDTNIIKVLEDKYKNNEPIKPKDPNSGKNKTNNKFHNFKQTTISKYSNDDLEKKLGIRK